jgi:hypothetical protein
LARLVHHRAVTTDSPGEAGTDLPAPGGARRTVKVSSRPSRLRPFPFHPLLLAAYPVLFLFSENLAEVALGETFQPILRAMAVAGAIAIVAGSLLRDIRRGALVASAVVVVWFTYGYVADLVKPMDVTRDVQLTLSAVFVLVFVVGAVVLRPGGIARLTTAVNVVALVLVALTLVNIVPYEVSRSTSAAVPSGATGGPRPTAAPGARDIYFLVFDRYGSAEALDDLADAHNDLPAWLESRGFSVAPDAHANYGRTTQSMAATLNMTYLDDIVARMGPDSNDPAPVNEMLQDHLVGRFLKDRGYRYVHIGNWFAPTRKIRSADENPVLTAQTDFGALLDDTTLGPTINEMRGLKDPPVHHLLHRAAALFDFNELDRVEHEPGPKFVLMHILLPHEPYVFAANGEYSGLSEADSKFSPAGFRDQLTFTNDKIRGIIDGLLSGPEESRPIIILEADEGPYPDRYNRDQNGFDWATSTPEELETKYGVLVAMYLPGEAPAGAPAIYPDMTLINTFPIVLDRYFDAGLPLLPDRSYTSKAWVRPYDMTDVTDRLAAIKAGGATGGAGPTGSAGPSAADPPDGGAAPVASPTEP